MEIQLDRGEELAERLIERGIKDPRVLDAIAKTPREIFVGPVQSGAAYQDIALPIDCGQTISQPFVVAYMTEKLAVEPEHEVLEIGTGSGYQAAVLARLARHVYSVERHAMLHAEAARRFNRLGIANITTALGDGTKGWPEPKSFDRIIVTAAAPNVPDALVDQLKQGGRMIVPVGRRHWSQRLVLIEKTPAGITRRDLLSVRFVPLVSE